MHRITNIIKISALTILCAALFTFTQACQTSTVITNLNAVIAAAQTALGILESSGQIPVGQANVIAGYLANVSVAATEAATELQSNDPTPVKVSTITHFFATSVMTNIQSFPPALIGPVQAVDGAIRVFLASIGSQPPVAGRKATTLSVLVPDHIKISRADRKALRDIAHQGIVLSQRARATWK